MASSGFILDRRGVKIMAQLGFNINFCLDQFTCFRRQYEFSLILVVVEIKYCLYVKTLGWGDVYHIGMGTITLYTLFIFSHFWSGIVHMPNPKEHLTVFVKEFLNIFYTYWGFPITSPGLDLLRLTWCSSLARPDSCISTCLEVPLKPMTHIFHSLQYYGRIAANTTNSE